MVESGGAPVDRLLRAIRSRLLRAKPVPLALSALGVAAAALVLFLALPHFAGPIVAESGQRLPPQQAGAGLDRFGVLDSDLDGLPDSLENLVYGTDPNDSGKTGIPDGWLVRHGFNPSEPNVGNRLAARPPSTALPPAYGSTWPTAFRPTLSTLYAAGRPADYNESRSGVFENGLDPKKWDANDDGLPDGWLLHYGLDPLDAAVGAKALAGPGGLTVKEAFQHNTDPHRVDTDDDGVTDRDEVQGPPSPRAPDGRLPPTLPNRRDTSGTGICDGYLAAFGIDPNQAGLARGDPDLDGSTTLDEFEWSFRAFGNATCREGKGLDPTRQSSGGAPIPDGWLIHHGLNPLAQDAVLQVTQSSDTDPQPKGVAFPPQQDGLPTLRLTVLAEYKVNRPADWNETRQGPWWGGTDPTKSDTDGDGLGDAWELRGFWLRASTDSSQAGLVAYATTSDPTKADSDGDGLPDGWEADPRQRPGTAVGGVTDPRRWDTDFDGIDDHREVSLGLGLDPALADTAGDGLRDGARLALLETRAAAYLTDLTYKYPGEPGKVRKVTDWVEAMPGAVGLPRPLQGGDLARLFGPGGNLDGDRLPNVVDPDMDGDELLNGWELDPALYANSPYGRGEFPQGRGASDPLGPDTDGDRLRDDWEVKFGRPDHVAGRYNLDPSLWDSNGNGKGDDAEDPDGDMAKWFAYVGSEVRENVHAHTNFLEQQYGTDPNRFDSDGDGLGDGWKVFWGILYPQLGPSSQLNPGHVYPGFPNEVQLPSGFARPEVGRDQSQTAVVATQYRRFALDEAALRANEALTNPTYSDAYAADSPSGTRTVFTVEGQVRFRFLDAQAAGTNPYLLDSEGDGMEDWWEILHATPLPGMGTVGQCITTGSPQATQPDGDLDPDNDGLPNRQERFRGTNPLCADSDLGGIWDGQEHVFGLNPALPTDDKILLENGRDTDRDGLLDFEELTGIRSVDYRHLGSQVRTIHDHPDGDQDGLLDGATQPNPQQVPQGWPSSNATAHRFLDLGIAYYRTGAGNYFFMGEKDFGTDPRNPDDGGIGVPAGWLAARNLPTRNTPAQYVAYYRVGMPTWWVQAQHGPWWGGASLNDDLTVLTNDLDLDRDGLKDRDGTAAYEDPLPAANHPNRYGSVEFASHGLVPPPPGARPTDAGLGAQVQRMLAQAFLSPRIYYDSGYGRDRGLQDTAARTQPCIAMDPVPGGLTMVKGTPQNLRGTLYASCQSGAPPAAHVTVEARLGNPPEVVGAGFSGPDGRFEIPVNLTSEHAVTMPPHAIVFRGNTSGTVKWVTDPGAVVPGPRTFTIRSYATPAGPDYAHRVAPLLSSSQPFAVTVHAASKLSVGLPEFATTGQDLVASVLAADSGGAPLQGRVVLRWLGQDYETRTATDGTASRPLPAPHSGAGTRSLQATFTPEGAIASYVTPASAMASATLRQPSDLRFENHPSTADAGTTVHVQGRLLVPQGVAHGIPIEIKMTSGGRVVTATTAATDNKGVFTANLAIPRTSPFGSYVVSAAAPAGPATEASQAAVVVVVRSIPSFVHVDAGSLAVARPAKVVGRLVEPDGVTGISNAEVAVTLQSASWTTRTDDSGWVRMEANSTLPLRPILQRLSFAGDTHHVAALHQNERGVLSTTQITIPAGRAGRGTEAAIAVHLADAQGRPVDGALLQVQWGKNDPHIVVTGGDGIAWLRHRVMPNETLGPMAVKAGYNGSRDASLGPSQGHGTWVVGAGSRIVLPNGTFAATLPPPHGVLRDAVTGTPLGDRTVRVEANVTGKTSAWMLTTDASGRFNLSRAAPPDGLPRRIDLRATFAGDSVYAPTVAEATLYRQVAVHVSLRAPRSLVAGQSNPVSGEVLDARRVPLEVGELRVFLGNRGMGHQDVANGNFRFNLTLPADQTVGPGVLVVEYVGDVLHAPASAQVNVTVVRPVQLRVEVPRVAAGEVASVRVRLSAGGSPIPFSPVHLAIAGGESGLVARTDKDGLALFDVRQGTGVMQMAALFAGDASSGPAVATLTLEPRGVLGVVQDSGPVLAWAILLACAALLVLASLAARLRRQPLEDALRRMHNLLQARGTNEKRILLAYRELEDAAIAQELLFGTARTARLLESALQRALPSRVHASLGILISLFEAARYGPLRLDEAQTEAALRALRDILGAMEAQRKGPAPAARRGAAA